MQMLKNTITKEDRRYQVSWSWRTENHNLPENCELSLSRLKTFEIHRYLLQGFDEITKDQLSKGVIEKVVEKNGNRKHYVPHHAITTPENSTTKVRVVYDVVCENKKES